ncbi:MAG: Glu-tRNA(Gln) amidotransferase subunit GatE, partial [Candidatus Aenigmatarchaeota archaeon]
DEEPPHDLNREALTIGLQLCKLLGCEVPDEIHVMRKTVIDGSNTGGFQRTAIIGMNGTLDMPFGNVPISQVCIEEEAARIEKASEGEVTYRLSGLGIPLLEITTGLLDDPQKAFETAKALGMLLRSLRVQRGIGTIRQDINVSITGGARVEIKGFQELEDIQKLIENEVKRQADLLAIRRELIKRKSDTKARIIDATDLFKATKNDLIRRLVMDGGHVLAVLLPEFGGLLTRECGDRTFGAELAGYARAHGLGGMIHSDEDLAKYKLAEEFAKIRARFAKHEKQAARKAHRETQDAIVILAGKLPAVEQAARAVMERASRCEAGVPEETRVADGTGSRYARPLPGHARMYPETDIPPISISREMLDAIVVPETLGEKEKELEKILPKELSQQILTSYYFPLYERLSKEFDPLLVARTFAYTLKEIRRKGFDVEKLQEDDFHGLFSLIKRGEIPADALSEAIIERINGKALEDIKAKFAVMPEADLRRYIKEVVEKNPGKAEQVLMGLIMASVRGRARGELVMRILREEMESSKLKR